MDVVVFVAGIADPRKPLPRPMTLDALLSARVSQALLSPFDEAAIEIALKLRDADAAVRITALLAVRDVADPLLRTLASLRLDTVAGVSTSAASVWDGAAVAAALAAAARRMCPAATLFLIGREFGDFDDGTVPTLLAARLDCTYLSLVTAIDVSDGRLRAVRQQQGQLQRVAGPTLLLASVTNDAGNRLRHPLLKNVMAARKATFDAVVPECVDADASQLATVTMVVHERRGAPCRRLAGSLPEQAAALAALLRDHGRMS